MGKRSKESEEAVANAPVEFSPTEDGKKKKSKKRKSLETEEQDPVPSNEMNGSETPKEKKKKKKHNVSDVEVPMTPDQCNGDSEETPKKKKKKNKSIEENGILTPAETPATPNSLNGDTPKEKKKKNLEVPDTPASEADDTPSKEKKKKKKKNVDETIEEGTQGSGVDEGSPKKKKKKNKNKEHPMEAEEAATEPSEEIVSTPVSEKKKKKKKKAVDQEMEESPSKDEPSSFQKRLLEMANNGVENTASGNEKYNGVANTASGNENGEGEAEDWICSCGSSNFASRWSCRSCKSKKDGGGKPRGKSTGDSNEFKIFCGNLSEQTTADELSELFSKHGEVVESFVIPGKYFGFVKMDSEESRTAAIKALYGHSLHDYELNCQPSKSREGGGNSGADGDWMCSCGMSNFASRFSCRSCKAKKAGGNSGGNFGGNSGGDSEFKIFIGNLSEETTGDDLNALFSKHGTVLESFVVPYKYFGFVKMDSEESRTAAIEALDGHSLNGTELSVKVSKSKGGDGAKGGDWECSGCGFSNFASRFQCFKCKTGKDGSAGGQNDGGDWNCQGCGFSNFASRSACFKCKMNSDGTPGSGGDEWTCPSGSCGFSNFSTRSSCYKCKTPNPNGGGSSTPSRPGDWTCSCGFSNFASRFECFKCKSPKDGGNKKITFDD